MEKAHSRIKWENYPSIATPLNETNLNKMDIALDEVDNRVLGLDTAKLDKAVANTMVKEIIFNEKTGIFTITSLDGTTKTFDTKLEKVATNFSYDYDTQKLKLTLLDGTEQEIDMSTLISQYEFADTSTIGFTVGNEGKITAIVKDGSITEDKLQPNFLADVKVEVAKAKSSSDSAYDNATASLNASTQAKQYRDEAKQFRDEAQAMSGVEIATPEKAGLVKPDGTTIRVDEDGTIHADTGTVDYTELENKPSINGVELSGDKSFEELGFEGTKDYSVLENKPSINGTELSGNKTLEELGIASKEELDKTVFKVDTIIEKADLGIKETAIGEEIHLTDSADGKAVEYALYGKATQDGTPTPENPVDILVAGESYNLLENTATSQTKYGITFTVNEDGSTTVSGTSEATPILLTVNNELLNSLEVGEEYIVSGVPNNANCYIQIKSKDDATIFELKNGETKSFVQDGTVSEFRILTRNSGIKFNETFYPMIRKASVPNNKYMPYGVGSVEVKSVGKNLLKNNATSTTINGVKFDVNSNDGTVAISGTPTGFASLVFTNIMLPKKDLIFSGLENVSNIIWDTLFGYNESGETITTTTLNKKESFTLDLSDSKYLDVIKFGFSIKRVSNDTQCSGTFYPMIRLATDTDATYEPYKGKTATIPTPNGIAGIKVSSGGNYTDQNGQQWICDEVVKYADGSGEKIERIKHYSLAVADMNSSDRYPGWVNISDLDQVVGTMNGTFEKSMCNIGAGFRINTENGQKTIYLPTSVFVLNQTEWQTNYPNLIIDFYIARISPITTPLTAQQLADIETFYPVTNITSDFDCEMKVKYKCDGKNYIDKRLALIEQALINNI